jgi:hypothetical protein
MDRFVNGSAAGAAELVGGRGIDQAGGDGLRAVGAGDRGAF